jgi:hypothetical protein
MPVKAMLWSIFETKKRVFSMVAEVVRLPAQHPIARILMNPATGMLHGVAVNLRWNDSPRTPPGTY